jgi:hypothetical protein
VEHPASVGDRERHRRQLDCVSPTLFLSRILALVLVGRLTPAARLPSETLENGSAGAGRYTLRSQPID